MSFEERLKTGQFGEQIIDAFLRQKGWVPYRPVEGIAHPFDRLVASPDKKNICIFEIKTKFRREAYADTGINRRHYDDYQHVTAKYGVPLFLAFVDAREGSVYGNWWHELLKERPPEDSWSGGCKGYPWEQRGIVYFPLSAMHILYVLTDSDRTELQGLRVSGWTSSSDDRSCPKSPLLSQQDIKWSLR